MGRDWRATQVTEELLVKCIKGVVVVNVRKMVKVG